MFRDSKRYEKWWLKLIGWTIPSGDPCEEPHEYVLMKGVEIDVQVAPLVKLLWENGIETYGSCQGDPNLYDLWCRYGLNHSQHGASHSSSLTMGSYQDAFLIASLIELYEETRINGTTSVISQVVSDVDDNYHFIRFPGHVLLQPKFIEHMRSSINSSQRSEDD